MSSSRKNLAYAGVDRRSGAPISHILNKRGMNSRQKGKYSQSKTIVGHRRFSAFSKRNGRLRLPLESSIGTSLSRILTMLKTSSPELSCVCINRRYFAETRGGNRLL